MIAAALSEVEATCDSAIIIHRGEVAAADSLAGLTERAGADAGLIIVLDGPGDPRRLRDDLPIISDLRVVNQGLGDVVQLRLASPDLAAPNT